MFKRVRKLFRGAPPRVDLCAEESVHGHIYEYMWDPHTTEVIKTVAEAQDVSADTIRGEIIDKQDDLLGQLQPLYESWERVDSQLRKELERCDRGWLGTSNLQVATFFALGVIGALLTIFFLVGLPSGLLPWNLPSDLSDLNLEWPDFGAWRSGVGLALLLYLPLHFVLRSHQRSETERSIPELEAAWKAAEKRFDFAASSLGAVSVRETLNERLTSFSTDFQVLDHRGLRALADPEREVSTAASKELSALIASLSSGSIGLSGPRGVGKTTLIESFARGRSVPFERERLGLVVSAPVKYDAKEFVLHLFASLCERVIGPEKLEALQAREKVSPPDHRRALVGVLGLAALLVAAAGAAMLVFDKTAPEGPRETAYILFAISGLMAFAWMELSWRFREDGSFPGFQWLYWLFDGRDAPRDSPEQKARNLLEQIRFQQTISSTMSGSVKLPLGLSVGGESSVTTARVPWSLPEAVEKFRQYAASLTDENYLVIGIDELDKMGSDASAKEFLNNVKGVFGVDGCYYLVSISDDAMAGFERRGMPVRDVFDSSFDAIQRIDYLTLAESRAVLESRVIGLPIPYQCLCHCLAGGLPRDLIRVTRELVRQALENELVSLEELTRAVVGAELRAKMAGAIEKSRDSTDRANEKVKRWLDGQSSALADPNSLREWVAELDSWSGRDVPSDADLSFEVAAFDYYAATVLEMFLGPSLAELLRPGSETDQIAPRAVEVLETLTKARQQFAIGPSLAWEKVAETRSALGLEVWEDPRQVKGMSIR